MGVGSKYSVRMMGYGEALRILVSLKGDRGYFLALSERELKERTSRSELLSALHKCTNNSSQTPLGNLLHAIDGFKPLTLLL
jgi:hypothetical protein